VVIRVFFWPEKATTLRVEFFRQGVRPRGAVSRGDPRKSLVNLGSHCPGHAVPGRTTAANCPSTNLIWINACLCSSVAYDSLPFRLALSPDLRISPPRSRMSDTERASSPLEVSPVGTELSEIAGRLSPIPKQLAQTNPGMIHFFQALPSGSNPLAFERWFFI